MSNRLRRVLRGCQDRRPKEDPPQTGRLSVLRHLSCLSCPRGAETKNSLSLYWNRPPSRVFSEFISGATRDVLQTCVTLFRKLSFGKLMSRLDIVFVFFGNHTGHTGTCHVSHVLMSDKTFFYFVDLKNYSTDSKGHSCTTCARGFKFHAKRRLTKVIKEGDNRRKSFYSRVTKGISLIFSYFRVLNQKFFNSLFSVFVGLNYDGKDRIRTMQLWIYYRSS